jgi:outer membrane protein OmpA-like peptidoglycan-associated protein
MRWTPTVSSRAVQWLVVTGVVLTLVILTATYASPLMVRHLLIARIHAITHRAVRIEAVQLHPWRASIVVRGLGVQDRDGVSPFIGVDRIELRLRPWALFRGHLWIREARIQGSAVRLVRRADGFNISDLFEGTSSSRRFLDVTLDHLVVTESRAALEDRALAEPRTWSSEEIQIEAHNLSTRRDDGRAVARSVTVGAPVSIELRHVRLYPIHLEAVVDTANLDLSLARLYFPADAALVPERGRATSTLSILLDARDGVRANGTSRIEDVALLRRGERDPSVLVPRLTMEVRGLRYRADQLELGGLELAGEASVKDPTPSGHGRFQQTTLRASLGDVTWPVVRPGRLDVRSSVPGGGTLHLDGSLSPPPAVSQLRLRLARVDLRPWARLVPGSMRVEGFADADLRVDEPLAPAVPRHVRGYLAVNQLAVADGTSELGRARRIEARDIEADWPRLAARRVTVAGPRVTLERDHEGQLVLPGAPGGPGEPGKRDGHDEAPSFTFALGELLVQDGRVAWRDQSVQPVVALELADLRARVTGAAWPLQGPLGIHVQAQPPGGGGIGFDGRVAFDPLAVEGRARAQGAEVGPYLAYAKVPARILGRVDFDLAIALEAGEPGRVTARGQAAAAGLDVRDGERTLLRVERARAEGVDLDWPRRVTVRDAALQRPWVLLERDRAGELSLKARLTPRRDGRAAAPSSGSGAPDEGPLLVTVRRVAIENGGARTVDQRVVPPFALDTYGMNGRIEGLSTDPTARPARVDLTGRMGGDARLVVNGSVGSLGGPLRLDLGAELHDFAVPRTNSYLLQQVAWEARSGSLSATVSCHVDGNVLDAKTDILIRRLEVARAAGSDEAQARIGLPLGTIVALMKDRHGDIRVSLPVDGRLNDPHFDMRNALWSTLRNVAVKTVTAPLSWIGRVRTGSDSMIQQVDVNPVPFAPGSAVLAPDAHEQVSRLATFLAQVPDVRLALIPVVTAADRAALDGTKPAALADKRVEAIRKGIEKAGADGDRLRAEAATDAAAEGDGAAGQVRVTLLEPETPSRPSPIRRLLAPFGIGGGSK